MSSSRTVDKNDSCIIRRKDSKICQACKVDVKKYTNPTCKIVYCSLKCYKQHKESGMCETLKLQLDEKRREDTGTKSEIEM